MATKTDIANVSLRRISEPRINDLDSDTTEEAIKARDVYDHLRKRLLRSHPWNFAVKRVELAQSSTAPAFGYDYAYPLPSGFLRVVSVHASDSTRDQIEYKIETVTISGTDTRCIVTNASDVYLRYIYDVENVSLMDESFQDALAEALARDLALSMDHPANKVELLEMKAKKALSYAKSVDGIEDFPDAMPEGSWTTSRDSRWNDGGYR